MVNLNYNALQLSLEKRLTRSLTILANYTYSKSLDTMPYGGGVTGVPNGSYLSPMPWYMPGFHQNDYGPSEFDHTHNFVISYVWALPTLSGRSQFVRRVLGDWKVSGIVSAYTGDPFTGLAGMDQSQTSLGSDRLVDLGGNHYLSGACSGAAPCVNWLNPGSFALPAREHSVTSGKIACAGLASSIGTSDSLRISRWVSKSASSFEQSFSTCSTIQTFKIPATLLPAEGSGKSSAPTIRELANWR